MKSLNNTNSALQRGFYISDVYLGGPWILAPMAGASDILFRDMVFKMGASAAPTELISAKSLLKNNRMTHAMLAHSKSEQPFWVQLFGDNDEEMARGATIAVDHGADLIDINMGCPMPKVIKKGCGCALLLQPDKAARLVEAMAKNCGVPITVKIRLGIDTTDTVINFAKTLERAGCAALSVHGRTAKEGYQGVANWEKIREIASVLTIPVIGNGDLYTANQAQNALCESDCKAVMIGRGALGNPWIFSELTTGRIPTAAQRWRTVRDHFISHLERYGYALHSLRRFRQTWLWYSADYPAEIATSFRQAVVMAEDWQEILALAEPLFSTVVPERERHAGSVIHGNSLG